MLNTFLRGSKRVNICRQFALVIVVISILRRRYRFHFKSALHPLHNIDKLKRFQLKIRTSYFVILSIFDAQIDFIFVHLCNSSSNFLFSESPLSPAWFFFANVSIAFGNIKRLNLLVMPPIPFCLTLRRFFLHPLFTLSWVEISLRLNFSIYFIVYLSIDFRLSWNASKFKSNVLTKSEQVAITWNEIGFDAENNIYTEKVQSIEIIKWTEHTKYDRKKLPPNYEMSYPLCGQSFMKIVFFIWIWWF